MAGAPLRFDAADAEQSTRHETFRLTRRGAWTLLEAQLPDGWHLAGIASFVFLLGRIEPLPEPAAQGNPA